MGLGSRIFSVPEIPILEMVTSQSGRNVSTPFHQALGWGGSKPCTPVTTEPNLSKTLP